MSKSSAVNAWADINSLLRTHKLINVGLFAVCLLQLLLMGFMYFSDPIVVMKSEASENYYSGKREDLPISEKTVKTFVVDFLKRRYEWTTLDPMVMRKNLAPIVTDGLNEKLFDLLTYMKDKEFQGKKTSQSIVNIDINVTEDKVLASFDLLLKIEGIPIPVPTTVSLNIVKGTPNAWNPIGLYVNGIKEHQSK